MQQGRVFGLLLSRAKLFKSRSGNLYNCFQTICLKPTNNQIFISLLNKILSILWFYFKFSNYYSFKKSLILLKLIPSKSLHVIFNFNSLQIVCLMKVLENLTSEVSFCGKFQQICWLLSKLICGSSWSLLKCAWTWTFYILSDIS